MPRRSIFAAATLLTFALLWMNRYRFDHMRVGEGDSIVRINRFTGKTEVLHLDGWREPKTTETERVPDDALDIRAGMDFGAAASLELSVYNASDLYLTELTIQVSATRDNSPLFTERRYRFYCTVASQQAGECRCDLGTELLPTDHWSFSVEGGRGRR